MFAGAARHPPKQSNKLNNMADELELDLDENNSEEIINRKDKRIKSLSEKFELSEKEKAEIAKAREEAEAKAQAALKDAEFYKGFNTMSSKYPGAHEYQDKIREKVMAGYDIEDAAVSILNKEGKLTPSPAPQARPESAIGGSAATGMNIAAEKPLQDMSMSDLRAQLLDAEKTGEFRL